MLLTLQIISIHTANARHMLYVIIYNTRDLHPSLQKMYYPEACYNTHTNKISILYFLLKCPANCLYLFIVWVMDDWRCKTGRRVSKNSRGGDWRWDVSTGMLILRRNPCLFTGWAGKVSTRKVSARVRRKMMMMMMIMMINKRRRDSAGTPEQKWEARRVTSELWECPVWAREVSSSAGCWCSPAVVQPCSLYHPRPASYSKREGENAVIMCVNGSHVISRTLFAAKHDVHNNFVVTVVSQESAHVQWVNRRKPFEKSPSICLFVHPLLTTT